MPGACQRRRREAGLKICLRKNAARKSETRATLPLLSISRVSSRKAPSAREMNSAARVQCCASKYETQPDVQVSWKRARGPGVSIFLHFQPRGFFRAFAEKHRFSLCSCLQT